MGEAGQVVDDAATRQHRTSGDSAAELAAIVAHDAVGDRGSRPARAGDATRAEVGEANGDREATQSGVRALAVLEANGDVDATRVQDGRLRSGNTDHFDALADEVEGFEVGARLDQDAISVEGGVDG